jgi:hypothetical protein
MMSVVVQDLSPTDIENLAAVLFRDRNLGGQDARSMGAKGAKTIYYLATCGVYQS